METKELAVVTAYIMYNDLFEDTRFDGSFFNKIDNAMLVAEEFIKIYPEDYEWGIEKEWDETLEEFVKNQAEVIITNKLKNK